MIRLVPNLNSLISDVFDGYELLEVVKTPWHRQFGGSSFKLALHQFFVLICMRRLLNLASSLTETYCFISYLSSLLVLLKVLNYLEININKHNKLNKITII